MSITHELHRVPVHLAVVSDYVVMATFRATARDLALLDRMKALVCGYYAWTEDTNAVEHAGSGVLVAPGVALSAKHVSKSFEGLDDRIEGSRRRITILSEQYAVRKVKTEFASMLYQAPVGLELMQWRVHTDWPSHDTDITTLAVSPESPAAVRVAPTLNYFEWQLLPPHWRAVVRVYGWPRQEIKVVGDDHEWNVELWVEPARVVEAVYPIQAHGFGEFPTFRLDRSLPHGFSGGPVLYNDKLVGIFSGPDLVACLWPLALHQYLTKAEMEVPVADLFANRTIIATDWDEIRGRVDRLTCADALRGSSIDTRCEKKHVVLSS